MKIEKGTAKNKKWKAVFSQYVDGKMKKLKVVQFGSKGMDDYTITGDKLQRTRYLNRHRKRENWNDPMTAGALSRWILWNKPTLKGSIKDFKKRFNLK